MTNNSQKIDSLFDVLEIKKPLIGLYYELLRLGSATAQELAEVSEIKRTSIYEPLAELEEKGLVKVILGRPSLYTAIEPKELLVKYKLKLDLLKTLIPGLENLQQRGSKSVVFDLYQGRAGMRKLSNLILEIKPKPKEILVISSVDSTEQALGSEWLSAWVKRRVKRGIATRGLVTGRGLKGARIDVKTNPSLLRQIHMLPSIIEPQAEINIITNYVAVFFPVKEYRAFLIKSEEFVQSLKTVFEFLWSITKRV